MEIDDRAGPERNEQILAPQLLTIGSKRYRTNFQAVGGGADGADMSEVAARRQMEEAAAEFEGWAESESANTEGIEQRRDGKWAAKTTVPAAFMGKLIGKKGDGKRRLEQDTKTAVTIPRRGDPSDDVGIVGPTAGAVDACRSRIEVLVVSALRTAPITHFISIPLTGPDFETMLLTFKEQAMDLGARGLSEELFPGHSTLHLTLGTLKLYRNDQIKAAAALLKACAAEVSKLLGSARASKQIEVKGVGYMNDDPTEVDVLYAKVGLKGDASADAGRGLLQQAADLIKARFDEAELIEGGFEREGVKLHATVINSKKRQGGGKRAGFDATEVLRKFKRFAFGESKFRGLHLSRMVPRARNHKGYYEPEAVAAL